MGSFKRISVEIAKSIIEEEDVTILDVRDRRSYFDGNINGSIHVGSENRPDFIKSTDFNRALIIYCYHGNRSQDAARYYSERGFNNVYSMDGGFEAWRNTESS